MTLSGTAGPAAGRPAPASGREPSPVDIGGGTQLHLIESGAGTPVYLLHGGMGDCRSWPRQLEALSQGHRVIAFSRRHHSPNHNPAAGRHCIDDDVEDLAALQQTLATGPAHLVGTSYGALVALLFALRHPQAVLSLALAEPPLHRWACRTAQGQALYTAFMAEVWLPATQAFEIGDDGRALQLLADGIAGHAVFDSMPPDRRAAAWRNAAAMKAVTGSLDPFPDLPVAAVAALPMPILLLRGERCGGLHLCVMEELAHALPAAAQAVIGNAGHGSHLENPGDFNAAVLSLWDKSVRRRASDRRPSSAGRGAPL